MKSIQLSIYDRFWYCSRTPYVIRFQVNKLRWNFIHHQNILRKINRTNVTSVSTICQWKNGREICLIENCEFAWSEHQAFNCGWGFSFFILIDHIFTVSHCFIFKYFLYTVTATDRCIYGIRTTDSIWKQI